MRPPSEPGRASASVEDEVAAEIEADLDAGQVPALEFDFTPLFHGSRFEREDWARQHLGIRLGQVGRQESDISYDEELFERVRANVLRIVAEHAAESVAVGPLIAPLLLAPAAERWRVVTSAQELRAVSAVIALLDGAELLAEAGQGGVEEIALAALHLTDRLKAKRTSPRVLSDLRARGWLLRVEIELARAERDEARYALDEAQRFQSEGTGEPLVFFATGRATAWLPWSEGRPGASASLFQRLAHHTPGDFDPHLAAEAWMWCALARRTEGDSPGEAKARAKALVAIGRDVAPALAERVAATARRLRLLGARVEPEPMRPQESTP